MSTDREVLRVLVQAAEQVGIPPRALRLAVKAARLHLASTSEPQCTCGTPGLTYDGPLIDCDRHGQPSAAFEAGRREGAQDQRDQQRIRGDLCRWCLREHSRGDRHGVNVPTGTGDPEVLCFDVANRPIPHRSTDEEPF